MPVPVLRIAGRGPAGAASGAVAVMEFTKRWAVQGRKPNGDNATTIFDVLEDRRTVLVYPATRAEFAVLIDGQGIRLLADTIACRGACSVPARHAVHGR